MKIFGFIISLFLSICAFAQTNPQDEEKQFQEAINKQIEQYTDYLGLDDWQVFYLDSILNHDYNLMKAEIQSLSSAKVSNSDVYQKVQDKWEEKIYTALQKVFDEAQWKKYLKNGAQRDKKARDKRAAKNK